MEHPPSSQGGDPHGHEGTAPVPPGHVPHGPVISPADLATFRAADWTAGRNIVVLMNAIFVMGLAGYIAICFWVA